VLPGEAERDRLVERLGAAGQVIEEHADGPLARDPSGNAFTLLTG